MADAPRISSFAGGLLSRDSASEARPASARAATHHHVDRRPVTRAGLIVNPLAGKASGKGLALAEKLRGEGGVTVRVLERFEQLSTFIDDMARDEVSDLFISSGDGTIQEILTQIGERHPFRHLPRLSLLPHGTTNLTAADLGFRSRSIETQADFIRRLAPADLRARHTIRCVNPGDGKARHGMFVGTGAVATGTLFCQQAFNARGVKGQWATFRHARQCRCQGRVHGTRPSRPEPPRPRLRHFGGSQWQAVCGGPSVAPDVDNSRQAGAEHEAFLGRQDRTDPHLDLPLSGAIGDALAAAGDVR